MTDRAIVIRTHYIDEYLVDLARAFAAGGQYIVAFAIDESQRIWDTAGFLKLSLTPESLKRLWLYHAPGVTWRCGDYVAYLATEALPDCRSIWIVENDVLVNFPDILEPFRHLDELSSDDLLATHVGRTAPDWFWFKTMQERFREVWRCFFPLVRISRRAAVLLLETRRSESAFYSTIDPDMVPNDEAFCATILSDAGFTVADINDYGHFYDPRSFDYVGLLNRHQIGKPDGRFYHSVRSGAQFVSGLKGKAKVDSQTLLGYIESDPDISYQMIEEELAWQIERDIVVLEDDPEAILASSVGKLAMSDGSERVRNLILAGLASKGRIASLNDVQSRFYSKQNLAFCKPAFQSSISWFSHRQHTSLDAQGANNGDRNMTFGFHTNQEEAPWWTVDLLSAYAIGTVVIYNRRDISSRLRGYQILVSPDGGAWRMVYEHPASREAQAVERIVFETPVQGRFVRISVPGFTVLHLVEVEIYAEAH